MKTRKVTVHRDQSGDLFVKFRVFKNHWLIIRPGHKDYVFDQGDKVNVSYQDYMNLTTGRFTIKLVGDRHTCSTWNGPYWNDLEWVGEQIKNV
ncbi:hypothetical protein hairong_121 [Pseudomonas phage hairong]|nr:hypothetical protein hairong_121 [Pseudomonas phage hairong]